MSEALQIKGIHLTFERGTANENHVLRGLDLTAKAGDFIAIIGGNGSGKSTLLNSIAGVYTVDEGAVWIDGTDVTFTKEHQRARLVGRVFQDPRLGTATRMTIEENLAIALKRGERRSLSFGLSPKLRDYFYQQVQQLELGLEERMNTEIGMLSGGQRQALTLLMATMVKPHLLLLDEHTAALDPKTAAQVMLLTNKLVTEEKLTTLMVTHNMHDALQYGNRLIMLHEGKVVVDLSEAEKSKKTPEDLVRLFKENSGSSLNEDRILLS